MALYHQALTRYNNINLSASEPVKIHMHEKPPSTFDQNEILKDFTRHHKAKAREILDHLRRTPDIGWNKKGELIYRNATVNGTNITKLLTDVISRQPLAPSGWETFSAALRDANIPDTLITNKARYSNRSTKKRAKRRLRWDAY